MADENTSSGLGGKRVALPLWGIAVGGFVLFGLGFVLGSTSPAEDDSPAAAAESEPDPTDVETTETEPESEPEPTTENLSREDEAALFASFITGDGRSTLASDLESLGGDVETVDKIAYDEPTETLQVSITSGWASPDNQIDGAWTIVRTLASLIWAGEIDWMDEFAPALSLTVSGHNWDCSAELMLDLGQLSADRSDWESQC